MIRPSCAGERQTVTRVIHPQRGPGWVVRDNGPTLFVTNDGVETPLRWCGSGGRADGSGYQRLHDPDHGTVDCPEPTPRESSPLHWRLWSPLLGLGWLVLEMGHSRAVRFESDDGRVSPLAMDVLSLGTPAYAAKMARARSRVTEPTVEERLWITLTLADGSTMAFRRDGAPPDAAKAVTR